MHIIEPKIMEEAIFHSDNVKSSDIIMALKFIIKLWASIRGLKRDEQNSS